MNVIILSTDLQITISPVIKRVTQVQLQIYSWAMGLFLKDFYAAELERLDKSYATMDRELTINRYTVNNTSHSPISS